MAIGKIYDSEELKRIDSFITIKDSTSKDIDKSKSDLNKKVAMGLVVIFAIGIAILSINYVIKK